MLDLLAEYGSFGHLGNLEVFESYDCKVEALLLTPQYQKNERITSKGIMALEKEYLSKWDSDRDFFPVEKIGDITLKRIIMPRGNTEQLEKWFKEAELDALICSGSKSNLSIPEEWHNSMIDFVKVAIKTSVPYLGICFGHQLLCKAFGGEIWRSDVKSEGTWPISITTQDEIFEGIGTNLDAIFTHQEHVIELPQQSFIKKIATSKHTQYAGVRMYDEYGNGLPVWGVQFHPESSVKVIAKSVEDGHEDSSRARVFREKHIGLQVLTNFASLSLSESAD